jgi:hypothetical protein
VLAVGLDLVTYSTFPGVMEVSGDDSPFLGGLRPPLREVQETLLGVVVYARFAVLAGLALALLWAECRQGRVVPDPAVGAPGS